MATTIPTVGAAPPLVSRIKLRPFQETDIDRIFAAFERSQRGRVMYQLATGAGKTDVGIEVGGRHLDAFLRSHVGWLTHKVELRDQSLARIGRAGLSAGDLADVNPGRRNLLLGGVAILSPGLRSVRALVEQATPDDLLIVDEAHHSVANSWERNLIGAWPGRILALTATPWRMSKKEGFDHLYDELVCGPPLQELIDDGYLSPFTVHSPQDVVIEGRGRGADGDYSVAETEAANEAIYYSDQAVRVWERVAGHSRRTIWYTTTVKAASALTQHLRARGHRAGMVHSKTPSEARKSLIADFATGAIDHLVNVAIVTEGFDCPEADCIVILRRTKSLTLYRQMGGRPIRFLEGKTALILDLGRSWQEPDIGHPLDEYPWSLQPRGPNVAGRPPVRWCSECSAVNAAGARSCVGCGAAFGRECEGCARFRFDRQWDDLEADDLCKGCQAGVLAGHIITEEEVRGEWSANERNAVLRHRTGNCLVIRSRYDQRVWVVGYRPLPGDRNSKMAFIGGYRGFTEAFASAKAHVAARFQEAPPAPEAAGPPPAPRWQWNADGMVCWHESRRCLVMPEKGKDAQFLLGYAPLTGPVDMSWIMGYPTVETAIVSAEAYLGDSELHCPPPGSPEHQASSYWKLSTAGYGVQPNGYAAGWLFRYPDPGNASRMVYVTGFEDEGEAVEAAVAHLGGKVGMVSRCDTY